MIIIPIFLWQREEKRKKVLVHYIGMFVDLLQALLLAYDLTLIIATHITNKTRESVGIKLEMVDIACLVPVLFPPNQLGFVLKSVSMKRGI